MIRHNYSLNNILEMLLVHKRVLFVGGVGYGRGGGSISPLYTVDHKKISTMIDSITWIKRKIGGGGLP